MYVPLYRLRINPHVIQTPCSLLSRDIAIRPIVDKKLGKLLEQEVIIPVMEPMDWVSSLAYSWKADGDLRTCLNPTHLNKSIRYYRTPTLKEITHELAGTGQAWLIQSHSSARFSFKLSGNSN